MAGSLMGHANRWYVGKSFVVGLLQIEMEERLTTKQGNRTIKKEYKKFRKNLTTLSGLELRSLQKARNLAEMGPYAFKYAHAGIDAALEVRWVIKDMEEYGAREKGNKVTPEEIRLKIQEIERDHPFPDPEGLEDVSSAYRIHADAICIFHRFRNAGAPTGVVTFELATELAGNLEKSLSKQKAEAIVHWLNGLPEGTSKSEVFAAWISSDKFDLDEKKAAPRKTQLVDQVHGMKRWFNEFGLDDDVLAELAVKDGLAESLRIAKQLVDRLDELVREAATETPAEQAAA